ncbi:MAG: universal stress protein [Saprospiraceae bacterium]|nr:universal stress protein [Saprospiraceae bacterium]
MVELKLYGTGTSGYQYLKKSLLDFLEFNHIESKIEEVNEVARFIADNIDSVPSLIINGDKPIEISKEGDFKKSINKIYHRITQIYGAKLTRKILVPTDFSSSASTALHFAKLFCKNKYYTIELMHVHHPDYVEILKHPYDAEKIEGEKEKILKKTAFNAEQDFIGDLTTITPVDPVFKEGLAGDVITDVSHDYEFIIMGSHGASNLFDSLLGSVSHTVASHSKCPVILVPPSVEFSKLSRICVIIGKDHIDITLPLKQAFPAAKLIRFEETPITSNTGSADVKLLDEIDGYLEFDDTLFVTSNQSYSHARSITDHTSLEPIYHKIHLKSRPLMVWPV